MMSDHSDQASPTSSSSSSERDELRTIAFRMREIQRLLTVRVEQENRKLEADDIDPVDTTQFQGAPPSDE